MDDRTTTTGFTRTQPLERPQQQVAAPKKRRWPLVLAVLAAAIGVGWWFYPREDAQPPTRRGDGAAAMPVVAVPAAIGDIDIALNALGTVTSLATVMIKTQISGQLVRDQAMLQGAELDLKRYQDLIKTNAIPRQQLDQQSALVLQDRGLVMSDQAQIDAQKLNITYCHIAAPVSGRVGLRLVDQGNYVTPGDSGGIAVITQLRP